MPNWLDIIPAIDVPAGNDDVICMRDLRLRFSYDVVRIGWYRGHEIAVKRDRATERLIVDDADFREHYRVDLLKAQGFGYALRVFAGHFSNYTLVQAVAIIGATLDGVGGFDGMVHRHMHGRTTDADRVALATATAAVMT